MKRNENNTERLILFGILLLVFAFIGLFNNGCERDVKYKVPQGSVCSVYEVDFTTYLTCDGNTVAILDGVNGTNGLDGIDADSSVTLVEICPDIQPSATFKEQLLLVDGKYMAFLSASNYRDARLVVLEDRAYGGYKTTDSRDIKFGVNGEDIICN